MGTEVQIGSNVAYLSTPNHTGPGLILIHEVWGLNANVRNIADRFAAEGYAVLAPDLLSGTGIAEKISPEILQRVANPVTRDEAQKEMREAMAPIASPQFAEETLSKLQECFDFLLEHESTTGVVAVLGFCFGGTYAFSLAAAEPGLACAIAFYGHTDGIMDKLDNIDAPILAFYGELDTALIEGLPLLEEAMAEHEVDFSYKVYPNTGHAFFNDTNPTTYNADAAQDSWKQSIAFLAENTVSPAF